MLRKPQIRAAFETLETGTSSERKEAESSLFELSRAVDSHNEKNPEPEREGRKDGSPLWVGILALALRDIASGYGVDQRYISEFERAAEFIEVEGKESLTTA